MDGVAQWGDWCEESVSGLPCPFGQYGGARGARIGGQGRKRLDDVQARR